MKKLILKKDEFQHQELPLDEAPERVAIKHKSTSLMSVADTPGEAWTELLDKLTDHYGMKVIAK